MADAVNSLPAETERELEAFVDDWMVTEEIPGAAVALVDDGETVYARGFGARDVETNAPATAETLFGVGSVTKSFTALSVMQLVEDGAVALEDAVSDHVDFLADVPGGPVTVRELLTHTSGMPADDSAAALLARRVIGPGAEVPVSSRSDFRRHVDGAADRRVTDEERFQYYNSGYVVLGRLVEAASGSPYAEYVRRNVLDPLGMERATLDAGAFEADDDAATAYLRDENGLDDVDLPFDEHVGPAGGLAAPASELATYLAAQAGGGSHDGTRLLDADLAAEMHEPHVSTVPLLDGTERHYGYGWMTRPFLADTLVGHGGSVLVSTAWVGFLAEANLGAVVACNAAPEAHPQHLGPALLALLRGAEPAETVPYYALREKFETVAGSYEGYRGVQSATVERAGGTLTLRRETVAGDQELPLVPESLAPDEYEFAAVLAGGQRLPVEFRETDDGMDLFFERARLRRED